MTSHDVFSLRHQDFDPSPDEQAVQESFQRFFERESTAEVIRGAEPLGFSQELWEAFVGIGGVEMTSTSGVGGASLVDLALIGEAFGFHLAPIPFVEASVACRLVVRTRPDALDTFAGLGVHRLTICLQTSQGQASQLVPAGAVSQGVIALEDGDLVLAILESPLPHVENYASMAVGRWGDGESVRKRVVLASGDDARAHYATALREWRILSASALSGLTKRALTTGIDFAKTRMTRGILIGSLQAIAHPLVDAEIAATAARNLARKAAWYMDHEPKVRPELATMAFVAAAQAASRGCATSVHVQGGIGVSIEADVTLCFNRAKGWSSVGGDPVTSLDAVAPTLMARAEVAPRSAAVAGS